jgi:hypothetical protein
VTLSFLTWTLLHRVSYDVRLIREFSVDLFVDHFGSQLWRYMNRAMQWPRCLRGARSQAAQKLGLWVQVPLKACMFLCVHLCYAVLCRYRPWNGLIPRLKSTTKCPKYFHKSILNWKTPEGLICKNWRRSSTLNSAWSLSSSKQYLNIKILPKRKLNVCITKMNWITLFKEITYVYLIIIRNP